MFFTIIGAQQSPPQRSGSDIFEFFIINTVSQIRLIAFDLDGTLLNRQRELSERNKRALQKAQDEGIVVCLASGRAIATILPFADLAGVHGPVVSCNGAYVVDSARQEVFHQGVPSHALKTILDFAERSQVHTNLYIRSSVYFSGQDDFGDEYVRRTRFLKPEISSYAGLRGMEATKMLFMDDPDRIEAHTTFMRENLTENDAVIAISERDYVEFLPPGVTKGRGLQEAAKSLGLERNQVAAIGDYWNDLEMIEWAGFSGAVSNAVEGVRSAADNIYPDHDEDGAAAFVDAVLAENRDFALR